MSKARTLVITGFQTCRYFQSAVAQVKEAAGKFPDRLNQPVINALPTRTDYQNWLDTDKKHPQDERAKGHRTSPFVYEQESGKFIGGHDDTVSFLSKM